MEAAAQVLDPGSLLVDAFQMHFNARLAPVPEGHVLEGVQVKAAAEFAIDAGQHVLVEGRRYALHVIVGSVQSVSILDQVKADQQGVARLQRAPDVPEKR